MRETELAKGNGLDEVTTPIGDFLDLIVTGVKDLAGSEVAHVATIGADFYIYQSADYKQYIAACQGHAGGDIIGPQRKRPLTYWVTPRGWTALQAWKAVIDFVVAAVNADLTAEWSH